MRAALSLVLAATCSFVAASSPRHPDHHRLARQVREETHELDARDAELAGYSGTLPKPYQFLYSNEASGMPPDPSTLNGWKYYAVTFWNTGGPTENAATWAAASASTRQSTHAAYKSAGVKLLVSAFGSGETPTTDKRNPATEAKKLATWVKAHELDGVDIDYEDFDACFAHTCAAWVIKFQKALRADLGTGCIITHAPIAPWFTTDDSFFDGGYLSVHNSVGSSIDFYVVQFYNQDQYYNTCPEIVSGGGSNEAYWPGTALLEIGASGVPLSKLVLGKPAAKDEAGSGFTKLKTLAKCVNNAQAKGWNTGVMAWAYPEALSDKYLATVWG